MGSRIIWLFIKGLSWIPGSVLRVISKIIYLLVYRLYGYRQGIVHENLLRSFPGWTAEERMNTEKKFYRHFSDIFPEMIRFVRLKPDSKSDFISLTNDSLIKDYLKQKKNLVILAGHYGNWEWNILALLATGYRLLAVYKPQSSRLADQLMRRIRQKPRLELLPMKETIRVIHRENESGGEPFVLLLIADQIPAKGDIHFWTDFLGQETAFFTGGEKIARRFAMPVLYLHQEKEKLGRYSVTAEVLFDGAENLRDNEITHRFVSSLESSIRKSPHLWLWTHRRWKYRKEDLPLH